MLEVYSDIIKLPHYELKNHSRMSIENRSAQFAPFSALSGFSEEVIETARIVDKKKNMTEEERRILDIKLNLVENHFDSYVEVIYFVPDSKKSGGRYENYKSKIRVIDKSNRIIIFTDKKKIKIDDVIDIKADFIKL
jgi:hypothetical protein